jgi:hypothetical protein
MMQRVMERCFGIRDDPERQSNWYYIGWYVHHSRPSQICALLFSMILPSRELANWSM